MTNESRPEQNLQSVWQSQPPEGIHMSLDEIRRRAGKLERRIYWRNGREYIAALAVVVFFGYQLLGTRDVVMGVGFGLVIAGMLYLMAHLHRQGSWRGMPAEMGLASGVEFLRRELERQRNLLERTGRWYLAPLVPGLVVITAGAALRNPQHGLILAAYAAPVALVFIFVWRLNQRAAQRLQRSIEELDALRGAN